MIYAIKTARFFVLTSIFMKTDKKRIWSYEWLKNRYMNERVYLLIFKFSRKLPQKYNKFYCEQITLKQNSAKFSAAKLTLKVWCKPRLKCIYVQDYYTTLHIFYIYIYICIIDM